MAAHEVSAIITCPACGKSYQYLSALAGHISFNVNCALKLIRNSGRVSLDLRKCLLAERSIPIIVRKCEICSLSCNSQVSYLAHMDHHFTGINYECSVCNFTFVRVCAFYKHTCYQPIPLCIFCEADKDANAERISHPMKTAENPKVLKVLQESSSKKQSLNVDLLSKKSDQQMKISKKHQKSGKDVALDTNEVFQSSLQLSQTTVSNANTLSHYGPSKLSFTTAGLETYPKYTSTSTHITSCGQATHLPLVNSTPIPALPKSFPPNASSTLLTARIQSGLKRAGESLDSNPSKVPRIDIDKLFEESDSDDDIDEDSLVQLVIPTINQMPASNPRTCNKNNLAEFLSESEDSSNPESKSSQELNVLTETDLETLDEKSLSIEPKSSSLKDGHKSLINVENEELVKSSEMLKIQYAQNKELENYKTKSTDDYEIQSVMHQATRSEAVSESRLLEDAESRSKKNAEFRSKENAESRSKEYEESRSIEDLESRPIEDPESRSKEDPKLKLMEEVESRLMEDPESRSKEDSDSRSIEDPESRSIEDPESRSIEDLESRSMEDEEFRSIEDPESRSMEDTESSSMEDTDSCSMEDPESISIKDPELRRIEDSESRSMEDQESRIFEDSGTMSKKDSVTSSIEIGTEDENYSFDDITDNDKILEDLSDCYFCHNCDPIQLLRKKYLLK